MSARAYFSACVNLSIFTLKLASFHSHAFITQHLLYTYIILITRKQVERARSKYVDGDNDAPQEEFIQRVARVVHGQKARRDDDDEQ
jgi:hypothetical protein